MLECVKFLFFLVGRFQKIWGFLHKFDQFRAYNFAFVGNWDLNTVHAASENKIIRNSFAFILQFQIVPINKGKGSLLDVEVNDCLGDMLVTKELGRSKYHVNEFFFEELG